MTTSSTPYFLFGAQRRYPYYWHGGAGGIQQSRVAAETRELSGCGCGPGVDGIAGFSLQESGQTPYSIHSPAFNRTRLHSLGDWPAFFPAGPEELDPGVAGLGNYVTRWNRASGLPGLSGVPIWDGMSDNEKKVVMLGGAAVAGWVLWKKMGKKARRNPSRRRRRRRGARR